MNSVAALMLSVALGTSPPAPSNFVPGEVIVKFVAGSDQNAAVARASSRTPIELADLMPVTKHLEKTTGIPLKATQVSSGNWVVLKIDVDRTNDLALERLRRHENVAQAQMKLEEKKYIGFSPPKKILLKFSPGSAESNSVAGELAGKHDSSFGQLISQLEAEVGRPLTGEVTKDAELLIQIDLKKLTLAVESALKASPDVEATQLNYVMRAF